MMLLHLLMTLAVAEEVAQVVPDTIYLPYSETEDVDFTIERPSKLGCYQWSCENEDMIELVPVQTDFSLQCGTRLELKILPKTGDPEGPVTLTILAENVDMENYEAAAQSVTFTVVVVPVAKLEVMGVKTELQAGGPATPFGVAAFDKAGNELDSLDGVRLNWFIGAKKDVAKFRDTSVGPIIHLLPIASGKGQVICLIGDPNYSSMEPALLDIAVTAPLLLQPDGAYLLAGGEAPLALYEMLGTKEAPELGLLPLSGPLAEHSVSSREEDVVRVDVERGVVVAGPAGDETSLLVKDLEGNIVKGVPVRTAKPHRMEVVAHPFPESKQLLVNHQYDINITIFDEDDHAIYPSENILTKTTFGKQFDIVDISVNGLWARVKCMVVGVGKIKASLRSTLTPEDDETELLPHIKGVTEFQIFEEVVISPRRTVLPWDSSTKPEYILTYKASGGGGVHGYRVEPATLGTVDTEGKVSVLGGPGQLTVTAGMSQSMHNNQTAQVLLLPPVHLELPEAMSEWMTNNNIQVPVNLYGRDPESREKVMYSDCSEVPLTVTLSNTKDFSYSGKSERGEAVVGGGCVSLRLTGTTPGATTKVTVSLTTEEGRQLSAFRYVATYENLAVVEPSTRESGPSPSPLTVLPIGSSRTLLYRGGPHPWVGKPSFYFSDVEAEDSSVVRAVMLPDTPLPFHAATVTCLRLGHTIVHLGVGNKVSSTNAKPGFQKRPVVVHCSAPAKVAKLEVKVANQGEGAKEARADRGGRVLTYSYRDFRVTATIKDQAGRTLDNVTSLALQFSLSSPSLASLAPPSSLTGSPTEVPGVLLPNKASQLFHPNGAKGNLDIHVAITGYREDVLSSVGVAPPPALPSPPAPFGEDEDEDYDYDYDDSGAPVGRAGEGLAEEINLKLVSDAELEALYD